jgi:cell division protein ZapE
VAALLERYQAELAAGKVSADPVQAEVMVSLDMLQAQLLARQEQRWYRRLPWQTQGAPRGRYLWGGVGRGKTWMMDLFFETLDSPHKQRIHFHRFMARVHHELRQRSSAADPLPDIAKSWARRCRILCFDEFFVSDIADAMLLSGLLGALFEQGVTLVATSNTPPERLYHGGLQRERFLPAIELIEQHTEVLHVGGGTDYRLRLLERSPIYHHPLDEAAEQGLEAAFERMAGGVELPGKLLINQRRFTARRRSAGIIWFSFAELCQKPRGANDYIEIARAFNTVLISGLEVLDDEASDTARRFINLVDEFYDRNVKLLLSAQVPISELYSGTRLAFEFERTQSRLVEMQSHEYLGRAHLP